VFRIERQRTLSAAGSADWPKSFVHNASTGGVGKMTVTILLMNTLSSAERIAQTIAAA
jgi:5,10-methylene-tetrahydrofolate dehydrogenase/methenyl tetrahydrofolate cyclohydrolase